MNIEQEMKKFEDWAITSEFVGGQPEEICREVFNEIRTDIGYKDRTVQYAWRGWQAARKLTSINEQRYLCIRERVDMNDIHEPEQEDLDEDYPSMVDEFIDKIRAE